jgi:hypothetical protein
MRRSPSLGRGGLGAVVVVVGTQGGGLGGGGVEVAIVHGRGRPCGDVSLSSWKLPPSPGLLYLGIRQQLRRHGANGGRSRLAGARRGRGQRKREEGKEERTAVLRWISGGRG